MSSTFFGLHVAGSGLTAASANINTTANNVSNVNTKGYSRQTVNVSESSSLRAYTRYGSVSTGVSTDSVTRERDQYYNKKYWANQSDYGYATEKKYYMDQIEEYFKDDATNPGYSTVFAKMFNSLDSLKSNSGDTTYRSNFISTAKQTCSYFNETSQNLSDLQSAVNDDIKTQVEEVNSIAQKIAVLNGKINVVETGYGHPTANELRDERELLLDQLTQIISVDTEETKIKDSRTVREHQKNKNVEEVWTGSTYFSVKVNGQLLVDGDKYNELAIQTRENKYNQSDVDGLYDIVWKKTGMDFSIWGDNQTGSLKGLFEIRDGNDKENLTGLAQLIKPQRYVAITDANTQQAGGTDANGNIYTDKSELVGNVVTDSFGAIQTSDNAGEDSSYIRIVNPSVTSLDEVSIPTEGTLWVNSQSYNYENFQAQTDTDGNIVSYTFQLKDPIPSSAIGKIAGAQITAGRTVDYKGIPYYQKQMNTFVRTLSREFNKLQKEGQDLDGNAGDSLFVADDKELGRECNFHSDESVDSSQVDNEYYQLVYNDDGTPEYDTTAVNGPQTPRYEYEYELDENGDRIADTTDASRTGYRTKKDSYGNPIKAVNTKREILHATASSEVDGETVYKGGVLRAGDDSYYRLTAANFSVSDEMERDSRKFSTTVNKSYNEELNLGADAFDLMKEMAKIESGKTLYRGGTADKFLQKIYSDVTVDTQECEKFTTNYTSIQQAIEKQRQSVSGVDEDEEAMNLMKYQQAYNLSCKVISTLTEMYDQLIRNTGV